MKLRYSPEFEVEISFIANVIIVIHGESPLPNQITCPAFLKLSNTIV